MNNNTAKLLNALYELNPQYKVNPLLISLTAIKKYFEAYEYNNKPKNGKPCTETATKEYNRYNTICKSIIDIIDTTGVIMPQTVSTNHKTDYLLFSPCIPTYSPKQQIINIKKVWIDTFNKPESATMYIAIFQAIILQEEETILSIQKEYLLTNTAIKLPLKELRIYTYFQVNPNATVYNCADYLGLMPIEVFAVKEYKVNDIQYDECKPFIYNKILR